MPRKRKPQFETHKKVSKQLLLLIVTVFVCLFFVGGEQLLSARTYQQANVFDGLVPHPNYNRNVEALVEDFFIKHEAPEMIDIIACESNFRHYERNGDILQNRKGSSAIGVAQIMSSLHPDPKIIERHNLQFGTPYEPDYFDITSVEGNLEYALLLYRLRGTKDWECAH